MITTEQVVTHARRLKGIDVPTIGRRTTFRADVDGDVLKITVRTTKKIRTQYPRTIKMIVDEFNRTHDFTTTRYQAITANASYTLAIIRSML